MRLSEFNALEDNVQVENPTIRLSSFNEPSNIDNAIISDNSSVNTQKQRGLWEQTKYFLGEAVAKPIARTIQRTPAIAGSFWEAGIDNLRNEFKKDLVSNGAVFGRPDSEFDARTPEAQGRVDRYNKFVTSLNRAEDVSIRLQENFKEIANKGSFAPDPALFQGKFMENPSWTRAVATGMESAPLLGLAAAVTAITKNPSLGAGVIGVIQGAEERSAAKKAGVSTDQANLIGLSNAVVNTALETIPLTSFLKGGKIPLKAFQSKTGERISTSLIVGAQEAGEEALQGLWTNAVAQIGYDHTRELTEGLVESIIAGGISGGAIGAFSPIRTERIQTLVDEAKSKGVEVDKITEVLGTLVVDNADAITGNLLDKVASQNIPAVEETKIEQPIAIEEPSTTQEKALSLTQGDTITNEASTSLAYVSSGKTGMSTYDNMLDDKGTVSTGEGVLTKREYYEKFKNKAFDVRNVTPQQYIDDAILNFWNDMSKSSKENYKSFENFKEQQISIRLESDFGKKNIENLKEKILGGKEIDMPVIETSENGNLQEGLHRALAAKELGLENIPVLYVYHPSNKVVTPEDVSIQKEAVIQEPNLHDTLKDVITKKIDARKQVLLKQGDSERAGKESKGSGYELSAILRNLRGEPTAKEFKEEQNRLEGNYKGKIVQTKQGEGEVVGTAFGKIRVKLANGEIKSFETGDIKSKTITKEEVIKSLQAKAERDARGKLEIYGFKLENQPKQILPSLEQTQSKESKIQQGKQPETQVQQVQTKTASEVQPKAQEQKQAGLEEVSLSSESNIAQKDEKVKQSKVFERAKDKYKQELGDTASLDYTETNIVDQMAKAFEIVDTKPENAKRIALGFEQPPEGMTETAISIAYAEKMLEQGKVKEASDAIRSRSLRQTERGQEIVQERAASTNVNDPMTFIKQVIKARMDLAGKKAMKFSFKEETSTEKQITTEKIKKETKTIKEKFIDNKKLDIEEAQRIIDSLIC